jgi:beta-galactosidase/beta-glucuronidase
MWRLSGIFRDVFVVAVPSVGIWDIFAAPDVDFASGSGSIRVYYSTSNHGAAEVGGYNLRVGVVDPKNETAVASETFPLTPFPTGFVLLLLLLLLLL